MATSIIEFAVTDEDHRRLDRLIQHFGGGDGSAFLKAMLTAMEPLACAERSREHEGSQR
jgi:hypothetical protein